VAVALLTLAVSAASAGVSLGAAPVPTTIPVVSHLRLSPSTFKSSLTARAGYGATVHFTLTEDSVQTYVVKMQQGTSWVTLKGSFVKRGRQGKDVFPFPGVVHGHKLKNGKYELVATPKVAGVGTGKPDVAHFTVIG